MLNKLDKLTHKIAQDQFTVKDGLCSRQRNNDSACNRCVDVCPVDAVSMEWVNEKGTTPVVDANKCNLCGACYTVCPNGVYDLQDEPFERVLQYADVLKSKATRISFDCELGDELRSADLELDEKGLAARKKEIAALRKDRSSAYVNLPCLARADESLLVGLASKGFEGIDLNSSKCNDCLINSVVPTIENSITTANRFLKIYGSATQLNFSNDPDPDASINEESVKEKGSYPDFENFDKVSRRSFLKKAKAETLSTGADMVSESIPDFFKMDIESEEDSQEGLIYELPNKRRRLIDATKALNVASSETELVGDLPFYSFDINSKCTGCKWCTMYCPTNALSLQYEDNKGMIQFTLAHCTKCDLCLEMCYDKAIDKLDTFSPSAFQNETSEDLNTQKVYKCADCKQEFLAKEYSQRCGYCDRKHIIFGEMDGEFLWEKDLKID